MRLTTEITVDEVLEAEDGADIRHEHIYGEVFALASGSVSHNVICANVVDHLYALPEAVAAPQERHEAPT